MGLAVHVLGVALDAVAAVDLRQRRGHVGCRAEEVGIGECTGELHPLLVPMSPQNTLDLMGEQGSVVVKLRDVPVVQETVWFLFETVWMVS